MPISLRQLVLVVLFATALGIIGQNVSASGGQDQVGLSGAWVEQPARSVDARPAPPDDAPDGGEEARIQVLGRTVMSSVRGNRADIKPSSLPSRRFGWIAAPVGICAATPCFAGSGFFETGYYQEEGWDTIHQYAASMSSGKSSAYQFWVSTHELDPQTTSTFEVLYNRRAARWEARLDSSVVYYRADLNFTAGEQLACGGEAGRANARIDVRCRNNQYRTGTDDWIDWIFTWQSARFFSGGYCVIRIGAYDFRAHGPGVRACPSMAPR